MKPKSSWGIIIKDSKYLFIQRSERSSRPKQWCVPGGGIKKNEMPEQACTREVKEEVGPTMSVNKLIRSDETFNYYLCNLIDSNENIKLQLKECTEFEWINLDDLLSLGEIMELQRMIRVFSDFGFNIDMSNIG